MPDEVNTMDTAQQVYEEVKSLPAPLAQEVLDFVGYLRAKLERGETDNLIAAQQTVLERVWDSPEDDVWNHA